MKMDFNHEFRREYANTRMPKDNEENRKQLFDMYGVGFELGRVAHDALSKPAPSASVQQATLDAAFERQAHARHAFWLGFGSVCIGLLGTAAKQIVDIHSFRFCADLEKGEDKSKCYITGISAIIQLIIAAAGAAVTGAMAGHAFLHRDDKPKALSPQE